MAIRTASICSGIGAMDLGIRLALPDSRTVLYVEREAFCVDRLVQAMQAGLLDQAPVWSDASSLNGRRWRGQVDLVAAGIPCQPHSCAGNRQGLEDPRDLTAQLVRIVREMAPSVVFVENVPDYIRLGLPGLLGDLAELGLDAEWDTFTAAEVGAPHLRRRMFLLAAHPDRWGLSRVAGIRLLNGQREAHGDNTRRRPWGDPRSKYQRLHDGAPTPVDELRAIGNAVVPLVVAHAFRTLSSRLAGGER